LQNIFLNIIKSCSIRAETIAVFWSSFSL